MKKSIRTKRSRSNAHSNKDLGKYSPYVKRRLVRGSFLKSEVTEYHYFESFLQFRAPILLLARAEKI